MDTSEQYIKMRLQAISDLGIGSEPEEPLIRSRYPNISIDAKGDWYYDYVNVCQLERQDQLQEMVGDYYDVLRVVTSADWYENKKSPLEVLEYMESDKFNSMEQLWLAFVMKEKHEKVWMGEEWLLK